MSYPQEFLGKPFTFWAKLESELKKRRLDDVLPYLLMENVELSKKLRILQTKYDAIMKKLESEL